MPLLIPVTRQTIIQPDDVIDAIQQFIEDRKEGVLGTNQANSVPASGRHSKQGGASTTARSQIGPAGRAGTTSSSLRCAKSLKKKPWALTNQEKEFWRRMASVVPSHHLTAWKQLEKEMISYNNLLKDRSRTLDTIFKLQEENASMKQLLNVYLADRVNEELIIPPTETFKLVDDEVRGKAAAH